MPKIFHTANWPFALKFTIPSLLALLLVCVIEYVSLNVLNVVKTSLNDVVERKYNASLLLEQSVDRLRAVNGELYLLQTKKAAGFQEDVNAETQRLSNELGQIEDLLTRFKSGYAGPDDATKIDSVLENVRTYRKAVGFVGSMLDIDFKATVTFIVPLRGAYEDMIGSLSSISNAFLDASRKASVRAEELAKARTRFIFIFSFAFLVLSMSVMLPIAFSTVKSIKALAKATVRVADGDTQIDFDALARHDELGAIVSALAVFRENVERVATLKKVSLLYGSMNAMLNSLQEGLFTFGPDGICSENYSKACVDLLKEAPAGKSIADVLHLSDKDRASLGSLLQLVFGENETLAMSPQSLLDMFPKYFFDADSSTPHGELPALSLTYRPILTSAEKVQSVLVIITDHSKEREAERQNLERQNSVLRILRVLSNRNMFVRFFNSICDFFLNSEKMLTDAPLDQIKRDVHTFKGAAGIYCLDKLAAALHDVESALPETIVTPIKIEPPLASALDTVRAELAEARDEISGVLGDAFDKQGMTRMLSVDTLKTVVDMVPKESVSADLRRTLVEMLMGESIHALLSNTQVELRDLSERYGKNLEIKIEGQDFPILTEVYARLFASFTHISRNIIKYAVEEPEVRQKAGKPEACSVVIQTQKFTREGSDWFRIAFRDDGSGVDAARLKNVLVARGDTGAANEDRDMLLQHVFDGDVSTSREVSTLGGRGVGLSAVREAATAAGGGVRIESVEHASTTIVIEVPLIWTIEPSSQDGAGPNGNLRLARA